MGIFDNVDWQQMLPVIMGGLSAGAAYGDPRSGPMLANSGWQAAQMYLRQQQMQQQKEEFDQRQKQLDKELGMRERHLKIAEDKAAQENEDQLQQDVMGRALPKIFEYAKKNGAANVSASAAWGIYQEEAKALGVRPDAGLFMREYNASQMLMGKQGPVMYKLGPGGRGLVMYDHATGAEINLFDKGFTEDQAEMITKSPELLRRLAEGQRAQAELIEDKKQKDALINGASGLDTFAADIDKKTKTTDYQKLNYEYKIMQDKFRAEEDELTARIGKRGSDGMWTKPLDTNNPEADEKARDDAWIKLQERKRKAYAGMGNAALKTKAGAEEIDRQLKKTKDSYEVSEEDTPIYRTYLEMYKDVEGLSYDDKLAIARAGVELVKKARESAPKKKPAEGGKKPVSVKPAKTRVTGPGYTPVADAARGLWRGANQAWNAWNAAPPVDPEELRREQHRRWLER